MNKIAFAVLFSICAAASAQGLRATSEQTVGGFAFPESVAYDPARKVLYVGEFGGAKLAPAEKDGLGSIAKVSLAGKVLEKQFLPAAGGEKLKRTYIYCSNNPLGAFGQFAERLRDDRKWTFHDVKTGHDAMVTTPGEIAKILMAK